MTGRRSPRAATIWLAATLTGCGGSGADPSGIDDGSSTTADAGTDSSGGETGAEPGDIPPAPNVVGVSGMRRLNRYEYDNTIEALVGDDSRPGSAILPEDVLTPFDNDYAMQQPSTPLIEGAELLAGEIAERLLADPQRLSWVVGCEPSGPGDEDCMREFIGRFGRRALRRPLGAAEVDELADLGMQFAAADDDFDTGVEVVVRALLQHAEFLYRIERGTPVDDRPGVFALDDFEIATRMSYLIWGTSPDEGLLDRAQAGELRDPVVRAEVAAQMLADDRARRHIDRFHALWLGYSQLPHAPALTTAMRQETAALIERVVFEERSSWLDLFTAAQTFVDATLAQHYGLVAPASGSAWVDYGTSGRQGILSHGSVLSAASNPDDTSPTKRGKYIRTMLMCQEIPPPPPDIDADDPPDESDGECKWDRYAVHRQSGACAGCHDQLDPVGFGLENYDRTGAFRAHDDGKPQCVIEGEGELVGVGTFRGPAQLADLLVENDLLDDCVVQQLYRYTMGRPHSDDELDLLAQVTSQFVENGRRFDELVMAVVAQPGFGYRTEE